MKEFKLFEQIGNTPGKNDKLALLQKNDSPQLRTLLHMTYNRFLTYRVKQIDFPSSYNEVQPDITAELVMLLELLAKHGTGSNEAKRLIKGLLSKCTEEGAKWVTKIITRDLKIGIDESTINKAFPNLVPVFDVQLAHPIYKKGKNPANKWLTLVYPVIVEEKLDGVRCIAIVKGGKVTFHSREGHEFDDRGVFAAEILKLRPGTDFVLDGEIIAHTFNPDNDAAVKNKDSNWPYEQGKSMLKNADTTAAEVKQFLGYYVWDFLELDYFESQGKGGLPLSLTVRKLHLTSLFSRNEEVTFNSLFLVPNAVARNEQEIKALFQTVRSKGGQTYSCVNKEGKTITYTVPKGEGVMVKKPDEVYEFKRSDAVLKVKEFYTCDLRVLGAYEGTPGTKYEGMLGGMVLGSDCGKIKTDCGSGFDDDLRYELWMMFLRGELVGKIVEVSYQEITADGSLRFPVFITIRDDKTTTNVE